MKAGKEEALEIAKELPAEDLLARFVGKDSSLGKTAAKPRVRRGARDRARYAMTSEQIETMDVMSLKASELYRQLISKGVDLHLYLEQKSFMPNPVIKKYPWLEDSLFLVKHGIGFCAMSLTALFVKRFNWKEGTAKSYAAIVISLFLGMKLIKPINGKYYKK